MTFGVSHDTAPSGATINSTVTLLLPDEDEEFPKLPWRAQTRVDSCPMATSHHATRGAAKRAAERSHASYMEVHSSPATIEFYASMTCAECGEPITGNEYARVSSDVDFVEHGGRGHYIRLEGMPDA